MFKKKEKKVEEIEKEKECGCGPDCECTCKEENKTEEVKQDDVLFQKEEEIGKLKAEVEDWKQSYLRKQAEFQNFTKEKKKRWKSLENLLLKK